MERSTRAETIANHLRQIRGLSASDARCLHLAFLECLGGAECASPAPAAEGGLRAYKPECDSGDCILPMGHAEDHWDGHGAWPRVSPAAEGPWVVRVLDRDADADKTKTRWDAGGGGLSADRTNAVRYAERASAVGAATWFERAGYIATVLPLAEAERAEAEGPLRTSYPHGAVVAPKPDAAENLSVFLRREECERKAARQAKPAGWVVRLSNGQLRWLWMRTVASGAEYEPYATREDAQRMSNVLDGVVPRTRLEDALAGIAAIIWLNNGPDNHHARFRWLRVAVEKDLGGRFDIVPAAPWRFAFIAGLVGLGACLALWRHPARRSLVVATVLALLVLGIGVAIAILGGTPGCPGRSPRTSPPRV